MGGMLIDIYIYKGIEVNLRNWNRKITFVLNLNLNPTLEMFAISYWLSWLLNQLLDGNNFKILSFSSFDTHYLLSLAWHKAKCRSLANLPKRKPAYKISLENQHFKS